MNSSGDTLWTRQYNSSGWLYSIVGDGGNGFYMSVQGNAKTEIVRIDSTGTIMWRRDMGYNYMPGWSVARPDDNSGVLVAGTMGSAGGGSPSIYICKLN
jgi:hypothetical protein